MASTRVLGSGGRSSSMGAPYHGRGVRQVHCCPSKRPGPSLTNISFVEACSPRYAKNSRAQSLYWPVRSSCNIVFVTPLCASRRLGMLIKKQQMRCPVMLVKFHHSAERIGVPDNSHRATSRCTPRPRSTAGHRSGAASSPSVPRTRPAHCHADSTASGHADRETADASA